MWSRNKVKATKSDMNTQFFFFFLEKKVLRNFHSDHIQNVQQNHNDQVFELEWKEPNAIDAYKHTARRIELTPYF